ncbi:glutamine synthetase family protein [Roseobacter sp. GAI101]|uniref:glutamine synthetase family protein n=1 Tax=Roseobacter sp. (strain GAI101) TaxID=391589 RepID=UPI00018714CC|nr:glutamine synthetase family protein [Roseobacter sp. GAI101]EEB83470.1 glutamate--ammonia ligase 1 [Roseobacter sp. GAI101]
MSNSLADEIKSGALASLGYRDGNSAILAQGIIEQVTANNIETVRLVFVDQHGILRGKTIAARMLKSAFSSGIGVPSTLLLKDTAHRTVFDVWGGSASGSVSGIDALLDGASDVLLVPDPGCFHLLPWSPHSAILMCDVISRTGAAIGFSSRTVLRNAVDKLRDAGFEAVFGLEVEFQIFQKTDAALGHEQATIPPAAISTRNLTQGWQYLTDTRYSEAEEILDTLRRFSDELGLAPRSMEVEMGPSQFEFTFDPSGPMVQAERFVLFRTMVKEVCAQRGLHATFMAKPKLPNAVANGWHIHQSLLDINTGKNLFVSENSDLTPQASGWIAGLLQHASASCLLTTPTVNGYKRFTEFQLAPNRITWGADNRGAMIRALLYPGDNASRIENRVADTTANPYYAFAAQILGGLSGITSGASAPSPTLTPYANSAAQLPDNLSAAIDAFEASGLFKAALGDEFVQYLVHLKRAEWQRYLMTVSEWEQAEYFNLF